MNVEMKKIKLLISDVDGVLTDGTFYKGTDNMEFKRFTVSRWTCKSFWSGWQESDAASLGSC